MGWQISTCCELDIYNSQWSKCNVQQWQLSYCNITRRGRVPENQSLISRFAKSNTTVHRSGCRNIFIRCHITLVVITKFYSVSCVYCKCPSHMYFSSHQLYEMPDKSSKIRTTSDLEDCAKLPKTSKNKLNCWNPPIFPWIPISNVVADNLHLFLRISDILMNLLILDARWLHAIDKFVDVNQDCHRFEICLKESRIVGFNFYVGKDSKKRKWPTLNGPPKAQAFCLHAWTLLKSFLN